MLATASNPCRRFHEQWPRRRMRLQVLLRIRPCPSARRITAESQSQRGQAPLRIRSYSSSDEWIRHDFKSPFRFNLSSFRVPMTDGKHIRQPAVKAGLRPPNAATDSGKPEGRNRKRSVCRYAHSPTVGSLFAGQRAVTLINAFWCEFLAAMPAFPFGSAPGSKLFGSFSLECTAAFR